MVRLIDADEVNEAIYKSFEGIQCYDGTGYDIYSESKESINEIPTVEAIPKDQYENRLKADMLAMLTDLQLEIEDLYPEHQCTGELTGFADAIETITPIIQQKIDKLKGEEDG